MVQLFFLTLENNKSDIGELRGLFTSLKKGQLLKRKVSVLIIWPKWGVL
jgi:hypothetical protein